MHLKKLEPHFNRMKKYSPCSTIPESIIFQRLALQASDCRHCHHQYSTMVDKKGELVKVQASFITVIGMLYNWLVVELVMESHDWNLVASDEVVKLQALSFLSNSLVCD